MSEQKEPLKFGIDRILSSVYSCTCVYCNICPICSKIQFDNCDNGTYCQTNLCYSDNYLENKYDSAKQSVKNDFLSYHFTKNCKRNNLDAELVPFSNNKNNNENRKKVWSRAVFSTTQRKGLERRFQIQRYITKPDRKQLADILGLTDNQVKIWFQNRRMKWRQSEQFIYANNYM